MSRFCVQFELVCDGNHAGYRLNGAQQRVDFMSEHRTREPYGSVSCLDIDCPRMRHLSAQRRTHTFFERAVIGLRAAPAPGGCETSRGTIRQIACRRVEAATGLVREAREFIACERPPPPSPVWVECVHAQSPDDNTG
jgi:hypothetical protein